MTEAKSHAIEYGKFNAISSADRLGVNMKPITMLVSVFMCSLQAMAANSDTFEYLVEGVSIKVSLQTLQVGPHIFELNEENSFNILIGGTKMKRQSQLTFDQNGARCISVSYDYYYYQLPIGYTSDHNKLHFCSGYIAKEVDGRFLLFPVGTTGGEETTIVQKENLTLVQLETLLANIRLFVDSRILETSRQSGPSWTPRAP